MSHVGFGCVYAFTIKRPNAILKQTHRGALFKSFVSLNEIAFDVEMFLLFILVEGSWK